MIGKPRIDIGFRGSENQKKKSRLRYGGVGNTLIHSGNIAEYLTQIVNDINTLKEENAKLRSLLNGDNK